MKPILLATTALSLATAAGAHGFYVAPYAGPNWSADIKGSGDGGGILSLDFLSSTTTLTGNSDAGYVIGGVVGAPLDVYGLSIELDASYRRNNLAGHFDTVFDEGEDPGPLPELAKVSEIELPLFNTFQGRDSTWALMFNAKYDYDLSDKFEIYALAGFGVGERHLVLTPDFLGGPSLDATESGFVYQLGAGAAYHVAKGIKVDVGYRYFQAPTIQQTVDLFPNPVAVTADGGNHSLVAEVSFQFD